MSTAIAPIELSTTELDQLCINTIRTLSIDAVQQAIPGIQEHPWRGAAGLHHLEPRAQVRSAKSDLAQSRPFRAFRWT